MTDRLPDRPDNPLDTPGLTVAEAAARLGVTSDAVYKGLRRKRYTGYKTESGEWRVVLSADQTGIDSHQTPLDAPQDTSQTTHRQTPDTAESPPSALLDSLQGEVQFLRQELETLHAEIERRDEETRRRDIIIAKLMERTPELPSATGTPAEEPSEPQQAGWRRWFRR